MAKTTAVVLGLILSLLCASLLGQEFPKVEIFVGYSRMESPHDSSTVELGSLLNFPKTSIDMQPRNGFDGSVTWNFNRWFGITGDVAGYYNDVFKTHTVLFGPQISFGQYHKTRPYAHSLFGVGHQSPTFIEPIIAFGPPRVVRVESHGDDTGFAMALGGGVDYNMTKIFSLRLIQADYLRNRYQSGFAVGCEACASFVQGPHFTVQKNNNLRLSFGAVFRFGE